MVVYLFLQLGNLQGRLWERRFVTLGQFLHPLGEGLADTVHLAMDGGSDGGHPFVIDDQRFDLRLGQLGVLGICQRIQLGLGFPDMKGFSSSNLKYMRFFAQMCSDLQIGQQPADQLPWFHLVTLLTKVSDPAAREWYASETLRHGWSRATLDVHIKNQLHLRQGGAITNFDRRLPEPHSLLASEALKDPYLFDFLGLGDEAHERDIENALIRHITRFLLELGAGFAFVGRQFRLEVEGDEFFIDLLFYHTRLKCYVVVELKATAFKPEHAGQLNFYLDRESHYLWGKRYLLEVVESDRPPQVQLKHSRLRLQVRPGSGEEKKQAIVAAWYRDQLRQVIPSLIAKWEATLGVKVERFFVQRMKTKWGSCSPARRSIRLNSELAKKPRECLEYLVVHEMVHLLEPTHNNRFAALMDQFLPKWQFYREILNRLPVHHEQWKY